MSDTFVLYALLAAVALYLIVVNRKRQSYRRDSVVDASVEAVWELVDVRPGRALWVPSMTDCVWEDEPARAVRADYATGQQLRFQIVAEQPGRYLETVSRIRATADAADGDSLRTLMWFEPEGPNRTRIRSEIQVERGPLSVGFGTRLTYPVLNRLFASLMGKELARRDLLRKPSSDGGRGASGLAGAAWRVALVATTVAWLAWVLGFWTGLSLLFALVVHEYGHVWSMRRNGHATARFYLIPFFGGVAIGSKRFDSDAEAAEIFLMGPLFGLIPALLALVAYGVSGDAFFAQLAAVLALCNGLNLVPTPPLDGGRVTQVLLRPLGDKAWYAISGLLVFAGAVAAAYLKNGILMAAALIGVAGWSMTTAPNPATRPLSGAGLTVVFAAYLALAGLHAALFYWFFDLDVGWLLDDGPAFLQ